ncbi:dsDNA nuclease domain-containing protein [Streptomyces mirabilis]|uniref:dsDNA nuclease domain-containing protein n=1 Tax=Streptomyces mirabilis TaxID=68239 RepID=UPI0036D813C9
MADPIEIEAPDDTGSPTFRRYEYQVHIAVQAVLEMLAGGTVQHVTCEHIEDIVVARSGDPRCVGGSLFWDFQQIKTRDSVEPWSLRDVISKGPLRSLWRTHTAVQGSGLVLVYQLTAGIEGHLDPADAPVTALSRGRVLRTRTAASELPRTSACPRTLRWTTFSGSSVSVPWPGVKTSRRATRASWLIWRVRNFP